MTIAHPRKELTSTIAQRLIQGCDKLRRLLTRYMTGGMVLDSAIRGDTDKITSHRHLIIGNINTHTRSLQSAASLKHIRQVITQQERCAISLPGAYPDGTVASMPQRPRRANSSRAGESAASSGVMPPAPRMAHQPCRHQE